jgi:hypothetical protein
VPANPKGCSKKAVGHAKLIPAKKKVRPMAGLTLYTPLSDQTIFFFVGSSIAGITGEVKALVLNQTSAI